MIEMSGASKISNLPYKLSSISFFEEAINLRGRQVLKKSKIWFAWDPFYFLDFWDLASNMIVLWDYLTE